MGEKKETINKVAIKGGEGGLAGKVSILYPECTKWQDKPGQQLKTAKNTETGVDDMPKI